MAIEAALADLQGDKPLLAVDGWNIDVAPATSPQVDVSANREALTSSWPATNLPIVRFASFKRPLKEIRINCGGSYVDTFSEDIGYDGGETTSAGQNIDVSAPSSAPLGVYQSERFGNMTYTVPLEPTQPGYTVRLHFAETKFSEAGKRKFNIAINEKTVLTDFDIFAEAGAKDKAVVKEFSAIAPDKDGNITIQFHNGSVDNAKIDGIEIVPANEK